LGTHKRIRLIVLFTIILLSKGVHPKVVQELLGHASVAITLDTYSHRLPGMGSEAATAMEDALSGNH
jgi:integrase